MIFFSLQAFPCISTGIFGYPNDSAAEVALQTTKQFLESDNVVERVIFCVYLPVDNDIYHKKLPIYFSGSKL